MKGLGLRLQQEAILENLTKGVLKTSEIEGEKLDAEQVHLVSEFLQRSSHSSVGERAKASRNYLAINADD